MVKMLNINEYKKPHTIVGEELGNFRRDWETAQQNKIKILEQKNAVYKIKNTSERLMVKGTQQKKRSVNLSRKQKASKQKHK